MNKIVQLNNGMSIGVRIAEITTIPYYELIDKNLDRANQANQIFFAQLLNGFYRKSDDGYASLELMLSSSRVDNQTYKAQVKIHFIIRQMGNSEDEINEKLDSLENTFKNEFTDNFFDIRFLDKDSELDAFEKHIREISTSSLMSVAKREDETISSLSQDGFLYHTFIPTPAENINVASISNVLTQYPESAILLQVIPTRYNQAELATFDMTSKTLQYYAGTMMRQMMRPDKTFQNMLDTYQTYIESAKEDIYYYNFINVI